MKWKRFFLFTIAYFITCLIIISLYFLYQIQIHLSCSYNINYLLENPSFITEVISNRLFRNPINCIGILAAISIVGGIISEYILNRELPNIYGKFNFTTREKNLSVIEVLSLFFYIIRFFSPFHAYYDELIH